VTDPAAEFLGRVRRAPRTGAPDPPLGIGAVRRHNLAVVLREVVDAAPLSRAAIAGRTGLTRGTVSSLVDELLADGLLRELDAARGGTGRPANPLALNPDGPGGLGLEIGVDHVAACVVDLTGAVRAAAAAASDHRDAEPGAALRRLAALADEVRASAGLPVTGAGVAVPGLVAPDGVLVSAPNLPAWTGSDLGAALSPLLGGLPVSTANEADLAALAERWFGAAPPDVVVVSGGIGVGAGILLDGRLFRGPGGRAGELGHVVVEPDGRACRCGGRGCLEQVAGQEALLRASGATDVADLVARGAQPRPAAALGAAARGLGVALAAAVNLLDVPAVVLGGVFAELGDAWAGAVAAELSTRIVHREDVTVQLADPGTGGALRAAAATVVRAVLARP
jgi:predicted NBD/HSP70 family sugar kinase